MSSLRMLSAAALALLFVPAVFIHRADAASRLIHLPVGRFATPEGGDEVHRDLQSVVDVFDETEDHDGLYRGIGTHYVNLYVGCGPNPQRQTVIVNTGGSESGFPCAECVDCGQGYHLNPNYNETESSCFEYTTCSADCDSCVDGLCRQGERYAEGSSYQGYEATDAVRIGSPDEDPVSMTFICQDSVTGLFHTQLADGIVSLNRAPSSLLNDLYNQNAIDQRQFSMCLRHVHEEQERAGIMVLGGADVRLHDTKMVFAKSIQGFNSRAWNVGVRKMFVSPPGAQRGDASFRQVYGSGNLAPVMDTTVQSGTTVTYLPRTLQQTLQTAWEDATGLEFSTRVAFTEAEVQAMPTIWFQLQGVDDVAAVAAVARSNGGSIIVDSDHPDDILLSFDPVHYTEPTGPGPSMYRIGIYFHSSPYLILGANWMSDKNVLFDMENDVIGFADSDCMMLETGTEAPETSSPSQTTGVEDPTAEDPTAEDLNLVEASSPSSGNSPYKTVSKYTAALLSFVFSMFI